MDQRLQSGLVRSYVDVLGTCLFVSRPRAFDFQTVAHKAFVLDVLQAPVSLELDICIYIYIDLCMKKCYWNVCEGIDVSKTHPQVSSTPRLVIPCSCLMLFLSWWVSWFQQESKECNLWLRWKNNPKHRKIWIVACIYVLVSPSLHVESKSLDSWLAEFCLPCFFHMGGIIHLASRMPSPTQVEGLEAANHPKHGVVFHQPSTWGARNAGAPSAKCATQRWHRASGPVVLQTVLLTLSPVAPAAAGQRNTTLWRRSRCNFGDENRIGTARSSVRAAPCTPSFEVMEPPKKMQHIMQGAVLFWILRSIYLSIYLSVYIYISVCVCVWVYFGCMFHGDPTLRGRLGNHGFVHLEVMLKVSGIVTEW